MRESFHDGGVDDLLLEQDTALERSPTHKQPRGGQQSRSPSFAVGLSGERTPARVTTLLEFLFYAAFTGFFKPLTQGSSHKYPRNHSTDKDLEMLSHQRPRRTAPPPGDLTLDRRSRRPDRTLRNDPGDLPRAASALP